MAETYKQIGAFPCFNVICSRKDCMHETDVQHATATQVPLRAETHSTHVQQSVDWQSDARCSQTSPGIGMRMPMPGIIIPGIIMPGIIMPGIARPGMPPGIGGIGIPPGIPGGIPGGMLGGKPWPPPASRATPPPPPPLLPGGPAPPRSTSRPGTLCGTQLSFATSPPHQ